MLRAITNLSSRSIIRILSPIKTESYNRLIITNNKNKYLLYKNISLRPSSASLSHSTKMSESGEQIDSLPSEKLIFVHKNLKKGNMIISFSYSSNGKSKTFNLTRSQEEPVGTSLERLKLNLLRFSKPRKVKKNQPKPEAENGDFNIELKLNDNPVSVKTKNVDAWVDDAVVTINGNLYKIATNIPRVDSMKLPKGIMSGFMVMPMLKLDNCTLDNCSFQWYREMNHEQKKKLLEAHPDIQEDNIIQHRSNFLLKLSNEFIYSTSTEDIGHNLMFECLPSDGTRIGPRATRSTLAPVVSGPGQCSFEKRQLLTKQRLTEGNKFRFVSYNILADLYADQDYSKAVLFAHCPENALDLDYRRQLLLNELKGYNADIYCMQEVDKKEFDRTFQPFFNIISDCSGVFNTKGGSVAEGEATFFRNDKFDLIHTHRTVLSELIEEKRREVTDNSNGAMGDTELQPRVNDEESQPTDIDYEHFILKDRNSDEARKCLSKFDNIRHTILSNDKLKSGFCNRHTIIQVSLLKLKNSLDNEYLLVGNTHLYFAPDADNVRLLQGSVFTKYIEYIKEYYLDQLKRKNQTSYTLPRISVIICGDMNSTPDCGLYKLLTTGSIDDKLKDWSSAGEEGLVKDLTVTTGLRFSTAYENIDYTNYTPGFHGCLDYIYYERFNINCERTIPLPDHKDVTATGGIPSVVFPSDHLPLIADFQIPAR